MVLELTISINELLHRYTHPGFTDMARSVPTVPVLLRPIVDDHDTMSNHAVFGSNHMHAGRLRSTREFTLFLTAVIS